MASRTSDDNSGLRVATAMAVICTAAVPVARPVQSAVWAGRHSDMDQLARLRPASAGALEPLATRGWGSDRFADGAFSEIVPGRIAETVEWSGKRLGRIHFAGEHNAFDKPGMEAAVVSGERAAAAVLAA